MAGMTPFVPGPKTEALSHSIGDYPDGIVIAVDKPYRWTSADVVRKVKYAAVRHFGKKNLKVGHAGTLDPLATGILLVCIGKATKKAEELQRHEKEYVAGVTFGATTPSFDLEKDIDREYPVDGITVDALEKVLKGFVGEQMQVAPLFSAKSVDGVRAYETARKLFRQGLPVEDQGILTASRINIYEIELLSMSEGIPKTQKDDGKGRIRVADISGHKLVTAMIRVRCSKGTYIRALARDLGEAMGSGAFLSSLRRTKNGDFNIEDAISLDKVTELFSENL